MLKFSYISESTFFWQNSANYILAETEERDEKVLSLDINYFLTKFVSRLMIILSHNLTLANICMHNLALLALKDPL